MKEEEPVKVPVEVLRTLPSVVVPEILGAEVLIGKVLAMAAVAALSAAVVPAADVVPVAETTERIAKPVSASWST